MEANGAWRLMNKIQEHLPLLKKYHYKHLQALALLPKGIAKKLELGKLEVCSANQMVLPVTASMG